MSEPSWKSEIRPTRIKHPLAWQVIDESVQGARHKRFGLPNQDAVGYRLADVGSSCVIAAVSDGHGSERCVRSNIGSQFAVQVAVEQTTNFLRQHPDVDGSLRYVHNTLQKRLIPQIVRTWKERVEEHAMKESFTEAERNKLFPNSMDDVAVELSKSQIHHAYGSTLLLVAITDYFAFYAQLGDGEILVLQEAASSPIASETDMEVHTPLPKDPRLIANETTSLCRADAVSQFRYRFQPFDSPPPLLVLLCTDGYSNAFESTDGFQKVALDLYMALRDQGVDAVTNEFAAELEHVSNAGSGDDVTVAVIFRDAGSSELRTCESAPDAAATDHASQVPQIN
jgi:serine/threonine protein phosphatase PrpC